MPRSPAVSLVSSGRGIVRAFFHGPRFIDVPLRLLAVAFASPVLLGLSPAENRLMIIAIGIAEAALIILAPWRPRAVLSAACLAHALALLAVPWDSWFNGVILFSVAVAVACGYWKSAALAAAVMIPLTLLEDRFHGVTDTAASLLGTLQNWGLVTLLGLAGLAAERQIQGITAARIEDARHHERQASTQRLALAADAHDTVSHTLATESAMISVLEHESRSGAGVDHRVLSELALVNAQGQRQLRQLLARLRGEGDAENPLSLEEEVTVAADAIRKRALVTDTPIEVAIGELPRVTDPVAVENAVMVLYELATNVVKHGESGHIAHLSVTSGERRATHAMVLRSRNRSSSNEPFLPRSLRRRSEKAGGSCDVRSEKCGDVEVTVMLPLPHTLTALRGGTPHDR